MHAALAKGQIFQVFPLVATVRETVVGPTWTRLLAVPSTDLVEIDVPDETRLVLLIATTEDLEGTPATAEQATGSRKLRPGFWTFCSDRPSGLDFWIAIDPRDTTPGVSETATITSCEATQ